MLSYYRQLISLRKLYGTLVYGGVKIVDKREKDRFAYWRTGDKESFFIECNLGRELKKRKNTAQGAERMLSNYPDAPDRCLRPYEAVVWYIPKSPPPKG